MSNINPSLLLGLSLLTATTVASAQSAVSEVISFSLEDVSELYMPPELYVDIDFIDERSNKILEALETGNIKITLSNKGGDADNVVVSVIPDKMYRGIVFEEQSAKTKIKADESVDLLFPISSTIDLPTDSIRFSIKVSEPMGYDIDASVVLSTYEYPKSKIEMQGVSIIDAGKGLRALNNNPDGKIQKGEVVKATVTLQNTGVGEAKNIKYSITSQNPNVLLMTESGSAASITGTIDQMLSQQ